MSEKIKNRIWELDFLRGISIIGVVIVHFFIDIILFTEQKINLPEIFYFTQQYGSIIFIALSGICVTLSSNNFYRGIIVFGCGLIISIVTILMFKSFNEAITFGILHFLGISMILSPFLKKIPVYILPFLSLFIIVSGYLIKDFYVNFNYLIPLGFSPINYTPMDYFPLIPYAGYFIIGIFLGFTLYKDKKTKFKRINTKNFIIKVFTFLGRKSLWIYLLHQPVIYPIVMLIFGGNSLLLQ